MCPLRSTRAGCVGGVVALRTPDPSVADPIFVIGPTRSGTTLVRSLLGGHRQIASIDELNFSTYLVRSYECLLQQASVLEGVVDFDHAAARAAVLAAHRGVRDAIAHARGKARWVDSTHTSNDRYADVLDDMYDAQCRWVLVRRHPGDVIASQLARWPTLSPLQCAATLLGMVRMQTKMCEEIPERATVVRYEELVAAPDEVMRRLLEQLGEDTVGYSPARALAVEAPRVRVGDNHIRTRTTVSFGSVGRWTRSLPPALLDELRSDAAFRASASAWGYGM